ncbi:DUF2490 domain-containing protein [uncultured Croceitalea sp.]|uniref:DUF2490 domain-containing protein n=1 Tax=uncultured Croceitalea sp. TaxID=1798908 RepID=UPI00330675D2
MAKYRYSAGIIRKVLLLGMVILFTQTLFSQHEVRDATGTWLVVSGTNSIAEKWRIPTVGIIRAYNLAETTEFGFFRTGLTYAPNTKYNFTVGAAYLDTQPFGHDEFETLTTQVWTYQEFCYNTKLYSSKVSQRFRLEQRWISKPTEDIFNLRLRYRLQCTKDLSKHLYLKVFDEPFLDFEQANINQNRFYLGLGRRITKSLNVEIGYMKNHVGPNNFDRIRMVILFKTNFYKKAKYDFTNTNSLQISQ